MSKHNRHSVNDEPHLRGDSFEIDPSEAKAAQVSPTGDSSDTARIEHTVWSEPILTDKDRQQIPADALTYERWLDARISSRSVAKSWLLTLMVAVIAGPWAILGALMSGGSSTFAVLSVTIFGPLVEEIMKVAGLLWIVEKRPFLFTSRLQIIICALCGGLVFAVIENFIYLNVYVPNPPESLVQWRWTVCTFLHCGCSLIAGMGLIQVWATTMKDRVQPNIADAARYLILAMVIHGIYNGFCVFLSLIKFQF